MVIRPHSSSISYRVYYKDTDAGRLMYHSKYLELMEIGRCEFLRERNLFLKNLSSKYYLLFPVVELKIKYLKPAFFDDLLTLIISLIKTNSIKIYFSYEIYNQNKEQIVEANTLNTTVNINTLRPCRIPKWIIDKIKN